MTQTPPARSTEGRIAEKHPETEASSDFPTAAPNAAEPDGKVAPEPAKSSPGTGAQEPEYASGLKLFTIMAAITLPCFLMLLDTSIVVTVSFP